MALLLSFFILQPRIDKITTEARQKNREVMTIQNQAQGVRDDSDRLKASVQGDCLDLFSFTKLQILYLLTYLMFACAYCNVALIPKYVSSQLFPPSGGPESEFLRLTGFYKSQIENDIVINPLWYYQLTFPPACSGFLACTFTVTAVVTGHKTLFLCCPSFILLHY